MTSGQHLTVNKLNLAYIVSTLGQTGPTQQLYNIIKYLDITRAHVNLITLSPDPENSLKPNFEDLGIRIHTLDLGRITSAIHSQKMLSHLLARIRPNIIHSQGFRADQLTAKLSYHPRRFATQRNVPETDYPLLYGRLPGIFLARLHRRALRRIPHLVSCSNSIARNNDKVGIKSIVIRNGVDLAEYPRLPTKEEKTSARSLLNLPSQGKAFVYAGPMINRKNPIFLVKAFLEFSEHSNNQFWLLGDGPLLGECRRLARDCPNVIVTGHVGRVNDYLKAADVFVSASQSEGTPNAILEALASGLPLVLSDIPAHREIIKEAPEVAQLFSSDDPINLVNCLSKVQTDSNIRCVARHLAESQFSGQSMARAYQDLYESVYSEV